MLPGALTNTPTPIEHGLSYRKPIQGAPLARRPVGFKGWEREARRTNSAGEGETGSRYWKRKRKRKRLGVVVYRERGLKDYAGWQRENEDMYIYMYIYIYIYVCRTALYAVDVARV